MDEFETKKQKLLGPVYLEAGAALFDCQSFEYGVAYLLYLLSRMGTVGLDPARFVAILEDEEKRTAGQLVSLLKKHVRVSEGIENILKEALEARNNLIHRYLIDNTERLVDAREHEKIVKEIRSLRSKVQNARAQLDPFVERLAQTLDGLDVNQITEDAKRQFVRDATEH
jgi:hypothetical protein